MFVGGDGLSFARGQGTIEYLVVVAVIVVISLIVVALIASQSDSFQGISSTANKIGSSSSTISISEAVVDSGGDGLVSFSNNSGGLLIITGLSVGGVDFNYPSTNLYQGETKTFSLSGLGSGCSCVGFEGKIKTCEVIIYAESEYGLEQRFNTSVSVNCVANATPLNLSSVIQPIQEQSQEAGPSYSIVLGLKDSFDNLPLTGFDIDCDGADYDFTDQNSPKTIDFNEGSYSCTFSKIGYDSNVITVIADSNKSLEAYLNPQIDYIHFSSCGTLNSNGAYYFLDNDIGSGGTCLTIAADNVKINGNGYTITGHVDASKANSNAYAGLKVSNATVDGNVKVNGVTKVDGNGSAAGSVTIINSTVTVVDATGGTAAVTKGKEGGNGGTVILFNSTAITVSASGGTGPEQSGKAGNGGTTTITDSNITTLSVRGGEAPMYDFKGFGGTGGTVTLSNSIIEAVDFSGGNGGLAYYFGPPYHCGGSPGTALRIN